MTGRVCRARIYGGESRHVGQLRPNADDGEPGGNDQYCERCALESCFPGVPSATRRGVLSGRGHSCRRNSALFRAPGRVGSFVNERRVEARDLSARLPRRWRAPPWRGRRDVFDVHGREDNETFLNRSI
jgi:hypothetical protein